MVMNIYSKNPIHISWLLPYLLFFGSAFWYNFNKYLSLNEVGSGFDYGFYATLFFLGIVGFALLYFLFRIEIDNNNFRILEFGTRIFNKKQEFLLSEIGVIYIRQTPLNRLFGLKNIVIELKDAKYWDSATLRAFGFSQKTFNAGMPGKYGALITIPNVKIDEADKIVDLLKSKSGVLVKDVGIGYPYYDLAVKMQYLFLYGFLFIAFLVFLLWIFLNLVT